MCGLSGECVRGVAGPRCFTRDVGLRQRTWFPLDVRCGGNCKNGRKGARGVPIGVTVGVFSASSGEGMSGTELGLSPIGCEYFAAPEREEERLEERDEDTGDEAASEAAGRSKDIPEGFVFSGVAFWT